MLAGDSFILLFAIFWLGITQGPFWLFGIVLLVGAILNKVHTRIVINQKIRHIEEIAEKTGTPIPPHIQSQIDEAKRQKGFSLWRSPLE